MADISREIKAFESAEYGAEVRGAMISLANAVNDEVKTNTSDVASAVARCAAAADGADEAADSVGNIVQECAAARSEANAAAAAARSTEADIADRLARGEFKGEKGDTGERGAQGASGVMAVTNGWFSMYVDDGILYLECPDESELDALQNHIVFDVETGNLYYDTE